jgi:hypothetical protein
MKLKALAIAILALSAAALNAQKSTAGQIPLDKGWAFYPTDAPRFAEQGLNDKNWDVQGVRWPDGLCMVQAEVFTPKRIWQQAIGAKAARHLVPKGYWPTFGKAQSPHSPASGNFHQGHLAEGQSSECFQS